MPYGSNFPSLNFRTSGSWGPGNGLDSDGRLTNVQVDENFDELGRAVEDIRDNPPSADSISNITSTSSSFTIHLDSGTTFGPFTLPVARLSWQGEWTAATAYQTNDLVVVTGDGVYIVLQDHTSAGSFDADAADSDGDFYHFMIGAGADGADGTDGTNGTDGEDGATWYTGIGAPSISDAVEGDLYLDTGDSDGTGEGDVYEHQGSDSWTLIASLKGEKGDTGDQGATGAGSTIIVEEGTFALASPVSNLNFDGDDFDVTQESDGTATVALAGAYSGALVRKASDETSADYSGDTKIAWDSEVEDTDGYHDNAVNNTRLTVPSGVSRVRVQAQVAASSVSGNEIFDLLLYKNGVLEWDGCAQSRGPGTTETSTSPVRNMSTPSVPVSPGDYFEVRPICSDSSITIDAARSWFAIEKVT